MAETTGISWADHTWNPWIGCTKVSAGCDHCYAERLATARLGVEWGPGAPRRMTAPSTWLLPGRWDRAAARAGVRRSVFPSLCDPFDSEVPDAWRDALLAQIVATPNLDWLLLTKRPKRAVAYLSALPERQRDLDCDARFPLPNLALGVSAEDQPTADTRLPWLARAPVAARFVSAEPLLGPLDLTRVEGPDGVVWDALAGVAWRPGHCGESSQRWASGRVDGVFVGGETGPAARPTHPSWVRALRDQCAGAGVAFHFKSWGAWVPQIGAIDLHEFGETSRRQWVTWRRERQDWEFWNRPSWCDDLGAAADCLVKVGPKLSGRLVDGVEHNGRLSVGGRS